MPQLVSIHGGHSGEFCDHAHDTLEAIVQAYITKGFTWVGITEHIPPISEQFLYPDELEKGRTVAGLRARFGGYFATARALQTKYADQITLLIGFEGETVTGSVAHIEQLRTEFQPDYIIGSVHHVADQPFDVSPAFYQQVAQQLGGLEALYCHYFDEQLAMIEALCPEVVGHLDLIRIFDRDYQTRMRQPAIWQRIERNLQRIKELDLILDFNVVAFRKGMTEPYLFRPILERAIALDIPLVPGDDSHSIAGAGRFIETGIAILQSMGASTEWRRPRMTRRQLARQLAGIGRKWLKEGDDPIADLIRERVEDDRYGYD